MTRGELPPPLMDRLRDVMREEAGMTLAAGKDYLVHAHLADVARRHGLNGAAAVLARLADGPDAGLRQDVVEAMAIRETSFFRDEHPFEALRTVVLPALLREARAGAPAVIWSAACATGQEPYSLAMLVWEHFPEAAAAGAIRIHATDLSRDVLARARIGRYSQLEVNRGVPAAFLLKYFDQRGLSWQVRPQVAGLVAFAPGNLAGAWPDLPRPHVMLARHVLMYLDLDTRRSILARVARHLAPGGWLFLGGTETLLGLSDRFDRVEVERTVCYRPRAATGGGT